MKRISMFLIFVGILTAAYPLMDRLYTWYWQQKALEGYQTLNDVFISEIENPDGDDEARESAVYVDEDINIDRRTNENSNPAPDNDASPSPNEGEQVGKEKVTPIGVMMIPKINLKQPLFSGASQKNLKIGLGHMVETSKIGEVGNASIAGHRSHTFGRFFNRLDEVDVNDEIEILIDGKTLKYIVYEKVIVEPTDISVLKRNKKDRILTLITCHPLYTSTHRLIIHAKMP
ncbi:MAG: hypothetical protein K0R93_563 [Anaerosolibacter sp.]|jgi:sortase A|uniref:class D sortase n=1 Tax=Anaerosolibacter sp. TaxID=1872527 RepID=UPI0026030A05|nr:class D sortase [Anaerosolibacter sp.]MDF2545665.1 hypothetical protein [Anaerosolibacter sp.]